MTNLVKYRKSKKEHIDILEFSFNILSYNRLEDNRSHKDTCLFHSFKLTTMLVDNYLL